MAPWPTDAQVEQDLVLTRAIVELFGNPEVAQAVGPTGIAYPIIWRVHTSSLGSRISNLNCQPS